MFSNFDIKSKALPWMAALALHIGAGCILMTKLGGKPLPVTQGEAGDEFIEVQLLQPVSRAGEDKPQAALAPAISQAPPHAAPRKAAALELPQTQNVLPPQDNVVLTDAENPHISPPPKSTQSRRELQSELAESASSGTGSSGTGFGKWAFSAGDVSHQFFAKPQDGLKKAASCFEAIRAQDLSVDQLAKPCFRKPPPMPKAAQRSGYCLIEHDITPKGRTENARVLSCSDDIFAAPSLAAVKDWYYFPTVRNAQPQAERNRQVRANFDLKDQMGNVILE